MKIGAAVIGCLLFVSAAWHAGAQTIIEAPPAGLQIIAWDGQSNAVGQAKLGPENILGEPGEYLLTLGGKWTSPAFEPSHTTEEKYGGSLYRIFRPGVRTGAGAAIYFLNKWRQLQKSANVGLVNVARNGTRIALHLPPTPLYMVGRAQLTEAKRYGSVVGFIWIQGEADARVQADAETWLDNFTALVKAWRADHGETVSVVVAQLGDNPNPNRYPYWDLVKEQQARAASIIPNVAVVSTSGMPREFVRAIETPHYTDEGYRKLGETLAVALYGLRSRAAQ